MSLRSYMKNWLLTTKGYQYVKNIIDKIGLVELPNNIKENNNILIYDKNIKNLKFVDLNEYINFTSPELKLNNIEYITYSKDTNTEFIIDNPFESLFLGIQIDIIDDNNKKLDINYNCYIDPLDKTKLKIKLDEPHKINIRILYFSNLSDLNNNIELDQVDNFDFEEFILNYCDYNTSSPLVSFTQDPTKILNTNLISLNPDLLQTDTFRGGCLSFNNRVYFAPYNAISIVYIDCLTKHIGYIPLNDTSANKYWGAYQAKDGYIYFCPASSDKILKLNPIDNSYSYIYLNLDNFPSDIDRWRNFIYGKNNCLYGVPYNNRILKYDLSTGNVTIFKNRLLVGDNSDTSDNELGGYCQTGCLSADENKIYFFPYRTRKNIICLNTDTDEVEYINCLPSLNVDYRIVGSSLSPDKKIHLHGDFNHNTSTYRGLGFIFDSSKNLIEVSTSTIQTSSLNYNYKSNSKLFPNGLIYSVAIGRSQNNSSTAPFYSYFNESNILTKSGTVSFVGAGTTWNKYSGIVLDSQGTLYFIPNQEYYNYIPNFIKTIPNPAYMFSPYAL